MGGWVPDPRGMAQNEREVYEGIEQEIKMPLDGAGNPEAKECEVSLTAPYFTWACFLVKPPFLVLGSRSDDRYYLQQMLKYMQWT